MSTALNIILITADSALCERVGVALSSNGYRIVTPALNRVQDLVQYATLHPAELVLVDVDPAHESVLSAVERLGATERLAQTRFIALADALSNDLLLYAMQAGVRHVLPKQSIEDELENVITRLAPTAAASSPPAPRGTVVTVLSAAGGCGATTLAVNVARELSEPDQPTLLIDLDVAYGGLAGYLGVETRYGLAHVLEYEGAIDPQLIRSSATTPGVSLHLLASPATTQLDDPTPLPYSRLAELVQQCRATSHATVIDAPRVPMSVAAGLVKATDHCLMVMQLSVKDLRMARTMLERLVRHGVQRGQVTPVVNRYARRHQMIGMREAARVLGETPLRCVRNDYRNAIRGLNYGQALADVAPRSKLRRDVKDLVVAMKPDAVQGNR